MQVKVPAGIIGKGIEIFKSGDFLYFINEGVRKPYHLMPKEFRSAFQSELNSDNEAKRIIYEQFNISSYEDMEIKFIECRYGNLDYTPDLIDGILFHDAPRCNNIEQCPGFGKVCKIPTPINGKLTRQEYRIITFIAEGLQTKEISNILCITDATTRTHIQRVHAKLGVNNNVEVCKWAHEHKIT